MNTSCKTRLASRWLLVAVSCAIAGTASADWKSAESPSITVRFADLNLATPEGAATLYSRIRRAARSVCGLDNMQPEERIYSNWKPCLDEAIEAAVTKVNSPMLTAVYTHKSDPSKARTLLSQRSTAE